MNCDQVFDILTRGPFPTGTPCDTPVEAHLNICPECRRLAEALRPAVELFQEAIGPEESRDLPGYWCAVAAEPQQPAVSYARQTETRPATRRLFKGAALPKSFSALTMWRMAAMLALGVTLGSLLNTRLTLDRFGDVPPGSGSVLTSAADDGEYGPITTAERAALAVLPAACHRHKPNVGPRYTERSDRLLADAGLGNLICCSECHHAMSDAAPKSATLLVSRSCQLCHRDGSVPHEVE